MHSQKLAIIIVAAIGMLTLFMPWVNGPLPGGMNTLKHDAWIFPALFAIPVLLCLLSDKTKPLTCFKLYAAILPAIVIALLAIWKIIDFRAKLGKPSHDLPFTGLMETQVSIGFGLYLLVLAALVLPVVAWRMK
ncbi:MAG: hypothetical protein ACYC1Q_14125 [Bacteroidia bacterium]